MNRYAVFHAPGSPKPNAFCFPNYTPMKAIDAAFTKSAIYHVYDAPSKAQAIALWQEDNAIDAMLDKHKQ